MFYVDFKIIITLNGQLIVDFLFILFVSLFVSFTAFLNYKFKNLFKSYLCIHAYPTVSEIPDLFRVLQKNINILDIAENQKIFPEI